MQGVASRESLAQGRRQLDALARSGGGDLDVLGDELFAVVALLDREVTLRRLLVDPARSGEDKARLLRGLLAGQLGDATLDLLESLVRGRWSSPRDLADAVEALGAEALAAAAERAGALDDVEDQLFRFLRVVDGQPGLRSALSDPALPADRRTGILDSLLGGRVAPQTLRLVRQAVLAPRGRTLEVVLTDYGQIAADRRNRLIARVTTAVALSDEQRRRLGAALQRVYGHEVHLDVEVDPRVLGGLQVRVGDEIVDGTIVSRLDEARRRLSA